MRCDVVWCDVLSSVVIIRDHKHEYIYFRESKVIAERKQWMGVEAPLYVQVFPINL